jgi:tetratricopeptide (TPR) repeat protein
MRGANRLYERRDYAGAADAMRRALERGEEAMLLYNLACYESLAGEHEGALAHLRRAIALDESYRALAADDPDFEPVRAAVSEL